MGKRINTAVWLEKYSRWQIKVQKDGERRTFTSSTPGRNGQREANAKADAWLDDGIEKTNTRVNILFLQYIDELKITTSKSNWIKIQSFWKNKIEPQIGLKKISKITEQDLQDIINKGFQEGLSKKTLSNLKTTIMNFLKYCRKRNVTTLHPESLYIPRGAVTKEKRILQPIDLITLFTVDTTVLYGKRVRDDYIYAYRYEVLTGIRPGELIGLEYHDIEGKLVKIQRSVNDLGEVTQGKNDNAKRKFVMTDLAKNVLEDQKEINRFGRVFQIESQSTYRHRWKRYCESNYIPYVSPYQFRHTFVSIAKSLPDGQIKPLVGHSKNMDTFGTYGHEVNGELEKTASMLNELFSDLLKSAV